jgi:hypothetical protein
MKMRNRTNILFATALFTMAFAVQSFASLIAYEGFNYADSTSLAGQSGGGSTGFSSAWSAVGGGTITVESPSLDGGLLVTSGNKVYIEPISGTTTSFRSLDSSISSGVTYLSFLGQLDAGTRFFGLSLFGTGGVERLIIGKQGGSSNWQIGTAASGVSTTAVTTESLLVVRIGWDASGANEDIRLWVNPSLDVSEPTLVSADGVLTSLDLVNFDQIRIASGNTNGTGQTPATGWFDEIRIGTTWADVTPRVIYREIFPNDAGVDRDLSETGWQIHKNAGTAAGSPTLSLATGDTTGSAPVNSNPARTEVDNRGMMLSLDNQTGVDYIHWTDEYAINLNAWDLDEISWHQAHNGTSDLTRVAIQLDGGQWYVTDQTFTQSSSVVWELKTLDWDTATWKLLDFDPGSSLALTGTPAALSGNVITAFGLYSDNKSTGRLRYDSFTITGVATAVPTPAALPAGLMMFGAMMLRRKS